jgi:hypothetical protein
VSQPLIVVEISWNHGKKIDLALMFLFGNACGSALYLSLQKVPKSTKLMYKLL